MPLLDERACLAEALRLRLRQPDWSANQICRALGVRRSDGLRAVRDADALLRAVRDVERRGDGSPEPYDGDGGGEAS